MTKINLTDQFIPSSLFSNSSKRSNQTGLMEIIDLTLSLLSVRWLSKTNHNRKKFGNTTVTFEKFYFVTEVSFDLNCI